MLSRDRQVPDKPTWCGQLDEISHELRTAPDPWVDRRRLQDLLGVGPRRAQQILAPCVTRQVGMNGLADREAVIAHLGRLAAGDAVHYEHRRRQKLAEHLDELHQERRKALLVAAPASIVNQEFANLPEGVLVAPGQISIRFETTTEALQKLLALAMAMRNDELLFERLATGAR
jgi:hypothetical protein